MQIFVSVVMPVRDVAPFLAESIQSILAQTHAHFEFVIRDDGSVDGSTGILREWAARDDRIRLFEGTHSLGPAASSNWVMARARGDFIARMDGDDIAHPDRLRRQIAVLARRPDAPLVASLWEGIDEDGRRVRPRDRSRLASRSPFAPFPHGSIMVRRAAFERVGGYRREADFWEDLDLYRRLAAEGPLLVLPAALYRHRATVSSTRLTSAPGRVEASVDRMYRSAGGQGEAGEGETGKVLPHVFLSTGSTRLWSGRSPAVLRPLLRRAALGWNRATLGILLWALWGSVSPRSLRLCLRWMAAVRDFRVRNDFDDDLAYPWAAPWVCPAAPRRVARWRRPATAHRAARPCRRLVARPPRAEPEMESV
ncbi:MAG TPA: glycosyltransferase family A protein [Allosphingosinicella sp.]